MPAPTVRAQAPVYPHTTELGSLDEAMSRPNKDPELIGRLISAVQTSSTWCDHDKAVATLRALASEQRLSDQNLDALAWTITRHIPHTGELDDVLVAICAHLLTTSSTVMDALWIATAEFITEVAQSSGSLLPGATWWRFLGRAGAAALRRPWLP